METTAPLTPGQVRRFREDGYLLMGGLFAPEETRALIDNFMRMHAGGPIPGCFEPARPEEAEGDILELYPRMMHPHRVNDLALRYLLDDRLRAYSPTSSTRSRWPRRACCTSSRRGRGARRSTRTTSTSRSSPAPASPPGSPSIAADRENGGLEVVPGHPRHGAILPRGGRPRRLLHPRLRARTGRSGGRARRHGPW